MMEEIDKWLKLAKEDYEAAEFNFKGKKYKVAAFLCQQAVEKAFKAVLLKKTGKIRKIHDLVELGKDIEVPDTILNQVKELTLAYIYSRYPDVKEESDLKEKVSYFLKVSKEALKWSEETLS